MNSTSAKAAKIEDTELVKTGKKSSKISLHPSHMERAFFLVPEERVSNLREFFAASARAFDASTPTLSLKTVWQLVWSAWRGEKLPKTLPL